MKINKKTLRNILTFIIVALALIMYIQDKLAPEVPAPVQPESSVVETLPEEEVPDVQTSPAESDQSEIPPEPEPGDVVLPDEQIPDEDGHYTSAQEVADYLHVYGHLPPNFITKNEARDLGWESNEGNLWEVAPGMSIGGDRFGNYEGLLPEQDGRKWTECDIDFEGGRRNAKRIVFSNDGLIYYTDDHYESFTQLY